jgi:hypothetical protein
MDERDAYSVPCFRWISSLPLATCSFRSSQLLMSSKLRSSTKSSLGAIATVRAGVRPQGCAGSAGCCARAGEEMQRHRLAARLMSRPCRRRWPGRQRGAGGAHAHALLPLPPPPVQGASRALPAARGSSLLHRASSPAAAAHELRLHRALQDHLAGCGQVHACSRGGSSALAAWCGGPLNIWAGGGLRAGHAHLDALEMPGAERYQLAAADCSPGRRSLLLCTRCAAPSQAGERGAAARCACVPDAGPPAGCCQRMHARSRGGAAAAMRSAPAVELPPEDSSLPRTFQTRLGVSVASYLGEGAGRRPAGL